jgi:molybdopterin synthase catalytic subunit
MTFVARLDQQPFDPAAELTELTRCAEGDGAVVSFVGLARGATKTGEPLGTLVLEHHPRLTVQSLQRIAADALERFPVSHVRVVHRSGAMVPGEAIVFAGAASPHRRAAFEAADYLMDRLKTEAVFWKREDGPGGSNWIEPTEADYADRGRWE